MFTTACEGGIGYWSTLEQYRWSKSENYTKLIDGIPFHSSHDVPNLDGFHAVLSSSEDDWGVDHAYQPRTHVPEEAAPGHIVPIGEQEELWVDIDVMERGWNLFCDKVIDAAKSEDPEAPFSRKYFRRAVISWLSDGEDGDYDSDVADLVVQLGLFGEVVYA